jgi:hypothetical protein
MNVERNTQDDTRDNDASLNAAMNSWQAPPLSPWFMERAVRRVAGHAAALRRDAWPWPPVRLAAATAMAAALGCVLSFVMPVADPTALSEVVQPAATQQVTASATITAEESDDMTSQLW